MTFCLCVSVWSTDKLSTVNVGKIQATWMCLSYIMHTPSEHSLYLVKFFDYIAKDICYAAYSLLYYFYLTSVRGLLRKIPIPPSSQRTFPVSLEQRQPFFNPSSPSPLFSLYEKNSDPQMQSAHHTRNFKSNGNLGPTLNHCLLTL